MKKNLIFGRTLFFLLATLFNFYFLSAQSNWTMSGTSVTTTVNSPLGYPHGVGINHSWTGDWVREYSFTYNSSGKLFSFGAFGSGASLNYGYIGGNTNLDVASSSPWMIFKPNGQVGIGASPVLSKLHVNYLESTIQLRLERSGAGAGLTDLGSDNDGLKFWVGGWNNNLPHVLFHANGKVGIGTTNLVGTHKLYVAGGVLAEQATVKLQGNWPDYVFEETHNIKPLSELESFIKANKHLPEIPSASEVKANGINLGEMDALLLKKIEELTLYVIEMKKEIFLLKEENQQLKSK